MRLRVVRLVVALLGLVGVLLMPGAAVAPGGQVAGQGVFITTQARAEQRAGGYRVYVDPVSGKFIDHPVGPLEERSVETVERLSTSHLGLVETPSPVPGGGYTIDLRGRFHSVLTAKLGDDGKYRVECSSGLAAPRTVGREAETTRSNRTKE